MYNEIIDKIEGTKKHYEEEIKNYHVIEGRNVPRMEGKLEGLEMVESWMRTLKYYYENINR